MDGQKSNIAGSISNDARDDVEMARMMENASRATDFLKALAHEGRLMILCHLTTGERSVTELEELLSQRQAAVSQQLARLRLEGLVESRRDGKAIYYRLADGRVQGMIDIIHDMFCAAPDDEA
jgi:ArsR family transcriptional regulator